MHAVKPMHRVKKKVVERSSSQKFIAHMNREETVQATVAQMRQTSVVFELMTISRVSMELLH